MLKKLLTIFLIKTTISWWSHGHMIISRIAEQNLSKDILSKINNMLLPLKKSFPENENSLLEASVVPDLLMNKLDGFLDFAHFINNPLIYKNDEKSDFKFKTPNFYNITKTFENSITIIKNYSKPAKKIKKGLIESLMLRYLLHCTGDIHQPLHNSDFYSKELYNKKIEKGDEGGNLIKVYNFFKKEYTNLHAIYDSAFNLYDINFKLPLSEIDFTRIDQDSKDLQKEYPIEYFGGDEDILDYMIWSEESRLIAEEFVYSDIDLFPVLRGEYVSKGREICKKRIVLAGYRLANLLKNLFG